MNRRNLLKSLFVVPLAAMFSKKASAGIVNMYGDTSIQSIYGSYGSNTKEVKEHIPGDRPDGDNSHFPKKYTKVRGTDAKLRFKCGHEGYLVASYNRLIYCSDDMSHMVDTPIKEYSLDKCALCLRPEWVVKRESQEII